MIALVRYLKGRFGRLHPPGDPGLVRDEILSVERLETCAVQLARSQVVSSGRIVHRPLQARLRDNERVLVATYRRFGATVDAGGSITPAAEWLLDNFHVVEEQIREIRQDLPPAYYRQLPQLASGPFIGYPRVFELAWTYVAHTDSRLEMESLERYLIAYQTVEPLTIGELWAVAITLRIVLVENLRRAAERSFSAQRARAAADRLANRLLGSEDSATILAGETREITIDFVAQLVHRLRGQDPEVSQAQHWLISQLKNQGTSPGEAVTQEHQRQSMANVTVRNIITSMRLMSEVDWAELFESASLVERQLRSSWGYPDMDFVTRDLYRASIERLARHSALSELDIATLVVDGGQVSEAADDVSPTDAGRQSDPGFRLLAGGLADFEKTIGYRRPVFDRPGEFLRRHAALSYFSGLAALFTLALAGAILLVVWVAPVTLPAGEIWLLGLFGLFPAADLAVALLNRLFQARFSTRVLPSLALRDGVPASCRTVVVVPSLLTTVEAANEQVNRLEIHFLASVGGALHFALLTDGIDAPAADMPGDPELVRTVAAGIARLNRTYPQDNGEKRFMVLHRRRMWNETERQWMGWERKRGKLHELNQLLRGSADTTFVSADGEPVRVPSGVKFVITLDADTRLPRDTVRRLIGKLAHPLNRPRFDAAVGRVVEGYAILQPRVTPSLPMGETSSLFQRAFSSAAGFDAYSAAASDLYQDLFGEGSYTGKGIYDIDAFESALAGRVGPDSLLSHDLFEGLYARAGLAADVDVVEDFPYRYDVAARRQHRWARGDWQLLPWIFGRRDVRERATSAKASLSLISQWKMIDNLRRSLSAPAVVLALFAGWTLPFEAALAWTLAVASTLAVPALAAALALVGPGPPGVTRRSHLFACASDLMIATLHFLLMLVFLADQAWLMGDAIARSLYRLVVSRRHLLQWVTAADVRNSAEPGVWPMYRQMYGGVLIAVAAIGGAFAWFHAARWLALSFGVLWIAAPWIARIASRTGQFEAGPVVAADDAFKLRQIARRTWRYFETYVTADENMLPPDNVQEDPARTIAHRTSPTNIGLYLLATVSARDFGWIGQTDMVDRLEATVATLQRLQWFRGHLYNWYDTRDLRVLEPGYISSVDSGNLAAHLVTVGMACRETAAPVSAVRDPVAGVLDSLQLAREAADALTGIRPDRHVLRDEISLALRDVAVALAPGPTRESWREALTAASEPAAILVDAAHALAVGHAESDYEDLVFWAGATQQAIASHLSDLLLTVEQKGSRQARMGRLASTFKTMATDMDFGFLFDAKRRLLSIGYRPTEGTLDLNCYDLLASESRLASFVAIAKGDIPARHWFRLGRSVAKAGGGAALISWSGSMFEYLMPSLVMRQPTGSLIAETNRRIVNRQIDYATRLGLPWGISESAYNERDVELTYQYSNFGVPDLGLKRGLADSAVIAPYATALAAMISPTAAVRNFDALVAAGALGRCGFYEALDYTAARLPNGAKVAIVRAFMAHHQGMTIVAIANTLLVGLMRDRFHGDPGIQSTELLLHERPPREINRTRPWVAERGLPVTEPGPSPTSVRHFRDPQSLPLQTHLLTNGRYTVMLTGAGAGYSRCNGLAVTRWREDTTKEDFGSFCYLRDVATGAVWSAGFQPIGANAADYEVTFAEDRATIVCHRDGLTSALDVLVSPEDDAEGRCLTLANLGTVDRLVEVTSYAEIALAAQAADVAHPAFSKLFVETEFDRATGALYAMRRRRELTEPAAWASHHVVIEGNAVGALEFETDRLRFLGRGRGPREAIAATLPGALSGTVGTVLDPVFSLRQKLRIPAGTSARLTFWTGLSASRQAAADLVDRHRSPGAYSRAGMLAWTQARVQLRHLGISDAEACLFQRLAGHLIYSQSVLRPAVVSTAPGGGGPRALWALGISGDRPIALLRIDDAADFGLAQELLRAHEYWQSKRLEVDLVILNERASSYVQDLQLELETAVRTSEARRRSDPAGSSGGVFVFRADLLSAQQAELLRATARLVIYAPRGTLAEQIERRDRHWRRPPTRRWRAPVLHAPVELEDVQMRSLDCFNGLGGFSADGREYITTLRDRQDTPAPWINVIANPRFGFQVAVEGSGYTWSLNSKENQLTPWSNDPVTDRTGEAIYLRDEHTGEIWSPCASPVRVPGAAYRARHGQGYSRFEHASHGIVTDLVQFVPVDDAVKISRLRISNSSAQVRELSVTVYAEWVLGPARMPGAASILTSVDPDTRALLAGNAWDTGFGERVAFVDLGGLQTHWTADREEFIGRCGTLAAPAALRSTAMLSGRVGRTLDPCAVLQAPVRIEPGATVEIICLLGDAGSAAAARALVDKYRLADPGQVLAAVQAQWDEVLGTAVVRTPDRGFDLMLNRWLLYQTLACRVWARAAFYQASGAYGFRDQLQDGLALAGTRPAIVREHLLRAAGRQFAQGDVQHWWLPHSGQGVRTRISDDRVWLAYCAARYVVTSGDPAVLDETVPFLEGQLLGPDEHEAFFVPVSSGDQASLYEHCARGLDSSLATGTHGLPLIGTGDWNDGLNRVGAQGRGESVWLAWFLQASLKAFAPHAVARGDSLRAGRWQEHALQLAKALEVEGWDGHWYRRAFYDDGAPLGSHADTECRIDAIAQSWSVIAGGGDPARAALAMQSLEAGLIRPADGLALLFTPPFDQSARDPGYIKAYPPGLRENGGQYTHAAAWTVIALAMQGRGDAAHALFSMLGPVSHSSTRAGVERYKVEPYVVAADIYSVAPHVGRGGWTWYTGSAAWLYQAGLEWILGVRVEGATLRLVPCVPRAWPSAEVTLRHRTATYRVTILNPDGVSGGVRELRVDGVEIAPSTATVALLDDGLAHTVDVVLGEVPVH